MYKPEQLLKSIKNMENSKAKAEAFMEAMHQAEQNHDLTYQYCFLRKCIYQHIFYGNILISIISFPKLVALFDSHPELQTDPVIKENIAENPAEDLIWVYKWILCYCPYYYQISRAEREKLFEDYKRRCKAGGYNLRTYFYYKYDAASIYKGAEADEAFQNFMMIPRDALSDCKACEQRKIAIYYIDKRDFEKAAFYAKDIESMKLSCCGDNRTLIWLKMHYVTCYLEIGDFDKARQTLDYIKTHKQKNVPQADITTLELRYFTFRDLTKGLRFFKAKWKVLLDEEENTPLDLLYNNIRCAAFFAKLEAARTRKTVKIEFDRTFPLYREDNSYKIADLYDFFYNNAKKLADRFDKSNETDFFNSDLQTILNEEW